MSEWVPAVYRSDGAWIGIMPNGMIGVGVEHEGRATLEGSKFVPMWHFLEKELSECLDAFSRAWESLKKGGVSTPERLIELTVESAWNSGRTHWMRLAVPWAIEMAHKENFDRRFVREIVDTMAHSESVTPELRGRLRQVSSILDALYGDGN
jgi:hypothetical protein